MTVTVQGHLYQILGTLAIMSEGNLQNLSKYPCTVTVIAQRPDELQRFLNAIIKKNGKTIFSYNTYSLDTAEVKL